MNAFKIKNERKLLVKNKNVAYSFRRFSALPFYRDGLVSLLWVANAAKAMARKNRLKKKCACQDICLSTPPQEQGTRCQYPDRTNVIYPVNKAISMAEKSSPARCHRSLSSSTMATISAAGMSHTSAAVISGGKCWLYISWRNIARSESLLTVAYANSRISRAGLAVLNRFFITFGCYKQSKGLPQNQNSSKWVVYPLTGGAK
jgi:hypothetical protein